jgi:hypothetical protein
LAKKPYAVRDAKGTVVDIKTLEGANRADTKSNPGKRKKRK